MNYTTDKELDWILNPKDSHSPRFHGLPNIYKLNICINYYMY